jgi:prolyl-tRNA editing enzyme YbaK/EbsC (Cys-tRNA(Pro) deacylase)
MLNEKDLENFLKEKNVNFEILKFEENVISSEKAYEKTKGVIVKSILLICDNSPLLCILLGKDRINLEKIKNIFGCKDVRLAKAKEVREITGYDIGALPPFPLKQKIRVIVDEKVEKLKDDEIVFCGGGSHYHLLKISKKDLLKTLENFIVEKITE